jgi:outer membrane autotransporter protein
VLSAAISYAHAWDRTSWPSVPFGPSIASRGVDAFTGAFQVAAPIASQGWSVTPALGVLVSSLENSRFVERNAGFAAMAVHGDRTSFTDAAPYATVGLSRAFTTGGGTVVTPDVLVGYRYDPAATGSGVTLLAQDGTAFFGNAIHVNPNSALLGVSLAAHQGAWTGYVKYRATVSSDWNDQSLSAGLRLSF